MTLPRNATVQRAVVPNQRNGQAFRLPAAHMSKRVATTANVVQRMDDSWKSFQKGFMDLALTTVTAVGSAIFKYPNPIEMQNFTSCLCLVFNAAGKTDCNYKSGTSREVVFESIKHNWETHHHGGTFFDVCPYDENDQATTEWQQLMVNDAVSGIFGNRPLIVIIGHCAPGSSTIQNDDGKAFAISDVISAIRPALKSRCTIYLTPCNTGVRSASSPSFQDQFTNEMLKELPGSGDSERLIIGTTSTSVPAKGKVLTTGQTYSRVKTKSAVVTKAGEIDEPKFLKRQKK